MNFDHDVFSVKELEGLDLLSNTLYKNKLDDIKDIVKDPLPPKNGVIRVSNFWDNIQLTKEERRNKSFEEIQELRKQKYLGLSKKE